MAENERGFHHPRQVNFERGGAGSEGGSPPHGGPHKHMAEPTNHGGVTHEMARTKEHMARVEGHRAVHAGKGQSDHEKILHDTHKLHQGPFTSHGNKYGASAHYREEAGEGHSRDPRKFMREEAAERRRGEE
jgi:hypothetical protein